MAIWNSSFKNQPTSTSSPSQGDDAIRELKIAVEERMRNEHLDYSGDGTGGVALDDWEHREGSAKVYVAESGPTTKPNGEALDANDDGRIWYKSSDNTLWVWRWDSVEETGAWEGATEAGYLLTTGDHTMAGKLTVEGGWVFETRTSDPSSPEVGRMWLRTDLA